MSENLKRTNQFRIRHLLAATTALAVLFAVFRLIGPSATTMVLVFSYVFAPCLACALSLWCATRKKQQLLAAIILGGMICVAFSIVAVRGPHSLQIGFLPLTVSIWVPQIVGINAVKAAWKSGLRSAGVEPLTLSGAKTANVKPIKPSGEEGPFFNTNYN